MPNKMPIGMPKMTSVQVGRFSEKTIIKDECHLRDDLFSEVGIILDFIKKHINKEFYFTGEAQRVERWQ